MKIVSLIIFIALVQTGFSTLLQMGSRTSSQTDFSVKEYENSNTEHPYTLQRVRRALLRVLKRKSPTAAASAPSVMRVPTASSPVPGRIEAAPSPNTPCTPAPRRAPLTPERVQIAPAPAPRRVQIAPVQAPTQRRGRRTPRPAPAPTRTRVSAPASAPAPRLPRARSPLPAASPERLSPISPTPGSSSPEERHNEGISFVPASAPSPVSSKKKRGLSQQGIIGIAFGGVALAAIAIIGKFIHTTRKSNLHRTSSLSHV